VTDVSPQQRAADRCWLLMVAYHLSKALLLLRCRLVEFANLSLELNLFTSFRTFTNYRLEHFSMSADAGDGQWSCEQ
jgi:hypothetical protein